MDIAINMIWEMPVDYGTNIVCVDENNVEHNENSEAFLQMPTIR